jgi:hypothetical protein
MTRPQDPPGYGSTRRNRAGDAMSVRFLLGTHQPGWLAQARVPLFVSDRRLRVYQRLPRAVAPWAVDSGGFTELQKYGRWTVHPAEYLALPRRDRRLVVGGPAGLDV